MTTPSFGLVTPPMQVGYQEIQRVWREADTVPEIGHAWLFDHLLPIVGDPAGPIFEGWTLLAALAAQTERLRLGLLVTSNRFRPPAVLAKIATTVDVVSGGRLEFGIGVGSRPSVPGAHLEYESFGMPYLDSADAIERFTESLTVIRKLWTEDKPFEFEGNQIRLTQAFQNPKPVQRPHPPIMIGGRASSTLRAAAEHADIWNLPGVSPVAELAARSALLDRFCAELGRDPREITRSVHFGVDYDDPGVTRTRIGEALEAGFRHFTLGIPAPYPAGVARWLADEVIVPSAG